MAFAAEDEAPATDVEATDSADDTAFAADEDAPAKAVDAAD
jgi:hypothetical protein